MARPHGDCPAVEFLGVLPDCPVAQCDGCSQNEICWDIRQLLEMRVVEQIRKDLSFDDSTAIHNLLEHLDDEILQAYLPEDD